MVHGSTHLNEFDTIWAPPGKAIDDGGGTHSSIQSAVDNTDSLVLVGSGTFDGGVTVSSSMTVMGTGRGTVIDGGSDACITVDSPGVTVESIKAKNDPAGTNSALVLTNNADECSMKDIVVEDTGGNAVECTGSRCLIMGCTAKASSSSSYYGNGTSNTWVGNFAGSGSGSSGYETYSDGSSFFGCKADGVSSNGIYMSLSGSVTVVGCTFRNCGSRGIRDDGGDGNVFANNLITGSGSDSIFSQSAEPFISGNSVGGNIDVSSATRAIVNGVSENAGAPGSSGQWNANVTTAYDKGVVVWDTNASPPNGYVADPVGSWRQFV